MNTPSEHDTDAEVEALAALARKLGYTTTDLVIHRLTRIIIRSERYTARRKKRDEQTSYDDTVAEDAAVIALAIQFLKGEKNT